MQVAEIPASAADLRVTVPAKGEAMKSAGIPIALAALLTGGLLTTGPISLRAADDAPDSPREQSAESAPGQVPRPDADATTRSARSASGVEMHGKDGDAHPASELSDLSGALLEDLVKQDYLRSGAEP
jgi:hypothetical protein